MNGALATLATLGIITAGAGAITMTATALAKKKEQDEAKAMQLATLQAQQSAQAQSAGANWAENQTMQANATQKVYTKVQQSQANIDFWASYVAWKIKAAEAEQKRRQAELEARIKAYYASLRLRPVSSQPVQPAPVLGLLAGLLTGARILGQGIRTVNQVLRNIANITRPDSIGSASGGGFVGGAIGGGFLGLSTAGNFTTGTNDTGSSTLSYGWGNNNLQQSQENGNNEDACERADQFELLGYTLIALTAIGTMTNTPRRFLQETGEEFLNGLSSYAMPSISVPLANECSGENGVINEIINTAILIGSSYLGFPLVGLGLVITKELAMGLNNISIITVEEYESRLGIRPHFNCDTIFDPYHTLGDQIVNYVEPFYPYGQGFPSIWDDGDIRFGYHQNPQPVTQILENNESLSRKVMWFVEALNNNPENAGLIIQHFDLEFADLMMSQPNISDILYEYPLIGQTTLIHYLANEGLLSTEIQSAIENHLLELGVSNPSDFIISIVNNSPDFQNTGLCN